ncbi:Regulator of rDNA transcription 14 [Lachancea thermotolerans]
MSSASAKAQATAAVNNVLSLVLPGSAKIDHNSTKRQNNSKGSKAQLINANLKKAVRVRERDAHSIKKREQRNRRKLQRARQLVEDKVDQQAKLDILRKHREEDSLTAKERKFLNKVINKNVRDLKSWDVDAEELHELQESVLRNTSQSSSLQKRKRKQRRDDFDESKKPVSGDHRYPGLTPGLAPVGLSDEEDSDEE